MDKDTQDIFIEGEAISDFVKQKAWRIIKQRISDKMLDLQSVMNIKQTSPETMAIEIGARQLAATYLYEILQDVEGTAAQHQANLELMNDGIKVI